MREDVEYLVDFAESALPNELEQQVPLVQQPVVLVHGPVLVADPLELAQVLQGAQKRIVALTTGTIQSGGCGCDYRISPPKATTHSILDCIPDSVPGPAV